MKECACKETNLQCYECERASDDPVNHPPHYTSGKVECIDAIESALGKDGFRSFLQGQIIKYTWRLGKKGSAHEDARKAAWYTDKLVKLEKQK